MDEADNTRLLQLLQISIDLRDKMTEVHRLRSSLHLAETARRGKRPAEVGVVTTSGRLNLNRAGSRARLR